MRIAAMILFGFLAYPQARAACPWAQPSDLLITSMDQVQTTFRPLSVAEIQEDLDCLRLHYETQYIAEYTYRQKGIRLTELVSGLRNSIAGPLTQEQLINEIVRVNNQAYDAHFSLQANSGEESVYKRLNWYSIYYVNKSFRKEGTAYRSGDDAYSVVSCEHFIPQPALDADGKPGGYAFVGQFNVSAPVEARCVTSENREITLPVVKLERDKLDENAGKFHFELIEGSILYVRIPAFTPGVSSEQRKLIELLKDESRNYHILFDLRQNPGGDDEFAYEIAKVLRPKAQKGPVPEMADKVSVDAIASSRNLFFLMWQRALQGHDPQAGLYEKVFREISEQFKAYVAENPSLESVSLRPFVVAGEPGTRSVEYPRKIALLYDKFCASSCESMMEAFSDLKGVIKIGSHSAGFLHFGNVGAQVLPHSKIVVFSGSRSFDYTTPVEEGLGYAPDFYFLGSDSLQAAVRLLLSTR